MVAVTGEVVGLMVTKEGMFPVPLAPNPIVVLSFVQLYTVPATGPDIVTAVVAAPAQSTWFAITFTVGVGFTVIVKLIAGPVHVTPPDVNVGVTVIVATRAALVVLVAVKPGIFPVPDAARPMPVLLFAQL